MSKRGLSKERFSPDRFFFSAQPRRQVEGWYYQAREGTFGPFPTREQAKQDLATLIAQNPVHRLEIFRHIGVSIRNLQE